MTTTSDTRTRPSHARRRSTTGLALAAVTALVAGSSAALPAGAAPPDRFPDRIELPDGFQPEGITSGRGPVAYVGSLADGDIYRADLRTGEGEVVSQGPGTPSVGIEADRRGRLFVAGGEAGDARVVDTRSGEVLASYQLVEGGDAFVNDVVVTRDAAWFTDSFNARLFRLPLGPGGTLPEAGEAVEVPLGGEWEQPQGFGANGITTTPDGSALLVVNSTTGELFRVDPATGEATVVDLGGALLTNGDGLLRQGTTLFAVLNQQNRVAVVELAADGRSGELVESLTDEGFDVPTTVARFGGALYLPNARFGTPPTPQTEYWITRVER